MGGLVLMVMLAISFYLYNNDIQVDLDNVEKSNTAKKYMSNAKTSQEQLLLKGEPNLFTSFINDDVSQEDQLILNRVYYELKNNSTINNDIVADVNKLCQTINLSTKNSIDINDCKASLNKTFNFLTLDSGGVNMGVKSDYQSALAHMNKLNQMGYSIDDTGNAKLSNKALYQFDSHLKEIEYMASGDNNYVQNDSITFNGKEDSTTTNKSELLNIINSSLTNSNTLINNIDISNATDNKYDIIKESLGTKDANGNYVDLISTYNDDNFVSNNTNTNIDIVNSFATGKSNTKESFSFYK